MLEKILFMSSSIETLPVLTSLAGGVKTVGLVTHLDAKTGRGQKKTTSLLKQEAMKKKMPVFQFDNLTSDKTLQTIKEFQPQIILTADFSLFLSLLYFVFI